jgi:hypothetical protein
MGGRSQMRLPVQVAGTAERAGSLGPATVPGRQMPSRDGIIRQPIICLPCLSRRRLDRGRSQRHRGQAARFRAASSPNAWRNRALIRDCHPGPASRSFEATSGSSRTLICSFVASDFGRPRPRRTKASPWNSSLVAQFRRQFRSVVGICPISQTSVPLRRHGHTSWI